LEHNSNLNKKTVLHCIFMSAFRRPMDRFCLVIVASHIASSNNVGGHLSCIQIAWNQQNENMNSNPWWGGRKECTLACHEYWSDIFLVIQQDPHVLQYCFRTKSKTYAGIFHGPQDQQTMDKFPGRNSPNLSLDKNYNLQYV
jgi:hypothetical protein